MNNHLTATGVHQLTLYSFSGSAAAVDLRAFIATGRPLKVPLYTSEEPPVANGAFSRSTNVGSSKKEGKIIPKVPHNFRRYLKYWVCLWLARPLLSRAWAYGQSLTENSCFTGWHTEPSRFANSCALCFSGPSLTQVPCSRKKAMRSASHGSSWAALLVGAGGDCGGRGRRKARSTMRGFPCHKRAQ